MPPSGPFEKTIDLPSGEKDAEATCVLSGKRVICCRPVPSGMDQEVLRLRPAVTLVRVEEDPLAIGRPVRAVGGVLVPDSGPAAGAFAKIDMLPTGWLDTGAGAFFASRSCRAAEASIGSSATTGSTR